MSDRDGEDPFTSTSSPPGRSDLPPAAPLPPDPRSENYLGILALVLPFVGLSAVGILLGHRGLAAVRKGAANNRGVALAGTILSWVVTGAGTMLVVAAIAFAIFVDNEAQGREQEAETDLAMLHEALDAYRDDHAEAPVLVIVGENYVMGDQTLPKSESIAEIEFVMLTDTDYCIALTYDKGKQLASSEPGVYEHGACPAPGP